MNDLDISIHTVIAAALWAAGGALILLHLFGVLGPPSGQLGLYLSGIGGVLNIRGFMCKASGRRERGAFDMGRESAEHLHPLR